VSDLEIIENFKDAIRAEGITPPAHIEADGKPHRFSTNGKAKDRAGYYTLHLDGVAAGGFGCFRLGIKQTWCSCDFKKLSLD
jgi:putative DNA primase/helicase